MEGEEAEHNIATGLAIMFLGMVFMVGFLFFMLAYPDDQVRHYSVRIVSSTVIIFMAIAIEYAALLSHCVAKLTGWKDGWKNRILPFFFYWSLTILVCYKVRHSHLNMVGAKSVLSHVSAFVAIYFFSDVMYICAIQVQGSDSQGTYWRFFLRCLVTTGAAAFLWILRVVTMKLVHRLPYDCVIPEDLFNGHDHPELEGVDEQGEIGETGIRSVHPEEADTTDTPCTVLRFAEHIQEAINEASWLVLSYLFVKFLLYKTVLEIFELRHMSDTYDQRARHWSIHNEHVVDAVCAMAAVVVTFQLAILSLNWYFSSFYFHRALSTVFAMSSAWSSMHFCTCVLMTRVSEEHCVLVLMAFFMTPLAGLLVLGADYLADTGVISDDLADTLVTSYGFMIGFSWEKAYHSATHILLEDYFEGKIYHEENEDLKFLWTVAICAASVLIMFPGWRYLILPSALRPLPPRRPVHAKTGQSCEDLPPETVASFVKG